MRGGKFGGHHRGRFDSGEGSYGRPLGHGELKYVVLSLLEKKPSYGYELIKSLEELSSGNYSPSPGVVYPTLTFLEESLLAESITQENKKLFSITAAGVKLLDENRETLNLVIKRLSSVGERMSKLKHWVGREDLLGVSRDDKSSIRRAMHGLKAELFAFIESDAKTKEAVAKILEKTTDEIRKLRE